jgi:hypothetical protein
MIQGNHHWSFAFPNKQAGIEVGTTSTQWLCRELGCHWLGFLTYSRFACEHQGVHLPLDVVACHGKSGSKLVGTSLNQVVDLKLIFPRADAFVMGHDHQLGAWKTDSLEVPSGPGAVMGEGTDSPEHLRISHQTQVFMRSGSCLRGFDAGKPSYPVGGLFRPTAMGMARLHATIKRTRRIVDGRPRDERIWDLKTEV